MVNLYMLASKITGRPSPDLRLRRCLADFGHPFQPDVFFSSYESVVLYLNKSNEFKLDVFFKSQMLIVLSTDSKNSLPVSLTRKPWSETSSTLVSRSCGCLLGSWEIWPLKAHGSATAKKTVDRPTNLQSFKKLRRCSKIAKWHRCFNTKAFTWGFYLGLPRLTT